MSAHRLITFASQTARRYTDLAAVGARLPEAPFGSLAHGSAGVAYLLMRHADFGGDPISLEAADHWVGRAEADGQHTEAFTTIDERLTDLPAESLLYHEPGVRWMRARVAAVGADRAAVVDAAARFAAPIVTSCSAWPGCSSAARNWSSASMTSAACHHRTVYRGP